LRVAWRCDQPSPREQATEPEQRRTTQIHKGNCGSVAVIDKRKCKAKERRFTNRRLGNRGRKEPLLN
jgi:hypothetical protein